MTTYSPRGEINMVKNGEHFMIKEMQQKGMSVTRIAEELGRDRKTIRKWLQEEEVRSYQRSIIKKSLLELDFCQVAGH
jgi:IS30 family transposase